MFGKKYATILICVLTLFSSVYVEGQPKPYFYKSSRPASFDTVLPGLSSFNFQIEQKDQYNFIEAYFMEELKKWITTTRPGIFLGIDYAKPSPEHVYIAFECSYRTRLASNGVWWWDTSGVEVKFTVAGLDYEYKFSLPNFSVQGNNFENHVLFNNLRSIVSHQIYQFNKSNTLRLPDYRSGLDENKIKSVWSNGGCRAIEGIYENIISDNGRRNNKYKLALKYVDDKPCLIYIGGAYLFNDWKEGEYKAWLEPTAIPSVFKAQWLMSDKSVTSAYVSFEQGTMHISISGANDTYIKIFPTTSDNVSIVSSQASEWSGTGFALKNGYIVTNFHVVDGAKSIRVHGVNGNTAINYSAIVVATDKANDLAIIQITDSRFSGFGTIPYAITNKVADVGEDVWVLGYPLTQVLGNEIKLTNGLVSSQSGYKGDVSTYQISAPVQPGNSGGPLFDSKGNVIGIVNAGVPDAENVGYAIKIKYLIELLEKTKLSSVLPEKNMISSYGLSKKVVQTRDFVFLIKASRNPEKYTSDLASSIGQNNIQPNGWSYLKDAAQKLKEKDYAAAVDAAKKANEYGDNAQAYLVLGQASLQLKKNADAISAFEKYLELSPSATNAGAIALTVGALYQGDKNYAKALEFYKKAQELGADAKQYIDALSK